MARGPRSAPRPTLQPPLGLQADWLKVQALTPRREKHQAATGLGATAMGEAAPCPTVAHAWPRPALLGQALHGPAGACLAPSCRRPPPPHGGCKQPRQPIHSGRHMPCAGTTLSKPRQVPPTTNQQACQERLHLKPSCPQNSSKCSANRSAVQPKILQNYSSPCCPSPSTAVHCSALSRCYQPCQ